MRKRLRLRARLAVAAFVSAGMSAWACKHEESQPAATSPSSKSNPQQVEVARQRSNDSASCPKGRWRLAAKEEMKRVYVPLAHIYVAYDQAAFAGKVSFSVGDWSSQAPPKRSYAEARYLARRLAQQASADPNAFSSLAREFSDDATTRDRGGSLGLFRVYGHHKLHPPVVDCIAALEVGGVSPVVESLYGFHVFRRLPDPPPAVVSGEEIVIGHRSAPWLSMATASPVPERSREEALAIARKIRRDLEQGVLTFAEAVRLRSDHPGKVMGGDLGQWSTRQTTGLPREMSVLSELEVGEVSEPIETTFGVKLLRRTANRPRKTYSAETLEIRFPNGRNEGGQKAARQRAKEMLAQVQATPEVFDSLRSEHCCTHVRTWREGSRWPQLTVAVAKLGVGELGSEPIVNGSRLVIARRVKTEPVEEQSSTFRLPDPVGLDLERFLDSPTNRSSSTWWALVERARSRAENLPEVASAEWKRLHEPLESSEGAARRLARIEQLLGAKAYSRYLEAAKSLVEERLMEGPVR